MRKMTPCLEVAGFPLNRACWLSSSNSQWLEKKKLWIQSCSTVLAIIGHSGWQLAISGILLVIKNHSPSLFQSSASCLSSPLKAVVPVQTSSLALSQSLPLQQPSYQTTHKYLVHTVSPGSLLSLMLHGLWRDCSIQQISCLAEDIIHSNHTFSSSIA